MNDEREPFGVDDARHPTGQPLTAQARFAIFIAGIILLALWVLVLGIGNG